MTKTQVLICPYCGETQSNAERCRGCGGLFEPLSRQATHNAMGPWFVRDAGKPFHPGCSYETLVRMIDRGQVTKYSIVRGPTTKQFWTVAKHVPGVAHLLGYCHNCDASVDAGDHGCHVCGVPFGAFLDRNYLGLPDVRPLPWDAEMEGADGGPAGPAGGMGRSSRATGISGFASDDELLGSAGRMHPISSSSASSESVFEGHASPLTTALRRKLESQHRTIRTLTILFVAVIIMSVLAVLALSRSNGAGVAPVTEPQAPVANAGRPAASQDTPVQTPEPVQAQAPAEQPGPAVEPEQADEAAPPAADPAVAAYTKARQLIASAARDDLPIEERIADLQAALDALKTAAAAATDADRPEDLDELVAQAQRELERLTLQKNFFGSD